MTRHRFARPAGVGAELSLRGRRGFRFPFGTAGRITLGMRKFLLLFTLFAVAQPGLHAQPAGNPAAPALADAQAAGARIFQQKCAVCHLPILRRSDTPYASRLDDARTARDRDHARRVIEDGNAAGMPGWKHTLRPAQIDALLTYLVAPDGAVPPAADRAHGGSASRVAAPGEMDALLAGTVTEASGEPLQGSRSRRSRGGGRSPRRCSRTNWARTSFPRWRAARYQVWAQAAGWKGVRRRVDLAGARQRQDFVLHETADFAAQLTGDQMVAALPEDTPARRRMKAVFVGVCTECHAANIVLHNRFDERGWDAVLAAMGRIGAMNTFREQPSPVIEHFRADLAAYLAEMRGPGPSPMRFEAPARPRGESTLPVVYEYDLPPDAGSHVLNTGSDWSLGGPSASGGGFGLHDATVDRDGNVWFTYNEPESATRTVGRVDTATGRVTDFTYARPDGLAATSHGIIAARDGAVWFNVNLRAPGEPANERLGRIDPRTGTLEVFTPPGDMRGMSIHVAEDAQGNIWGDTASGAIRYDPTASAFTAFTSPTQPGRTYGAAGDRDGNGWWTQIGIDVIGRADLATGRSSEIRLPALLPSFVQDGDFSAEDLAIYAGRGRGLQAPRRPARRLGDGRRLGAQLRGQQPAADRRRHAGDHLLPAAARGDESVHGRRRRRPRRVGQPAGRRRGREAGPRERRVEPLCLALAGHRLAQPGRRGTRRARGGHRRVLQREPDRPHGHAHTGGGAAGRILSWLAEDVIRDRLGGAGQPAAPVPWR